MLYLGRVAGLAAIALGTTALAGCVAPPPPPPLAAAAAPTQNLPPAPPPAFGMAAPYQTPAYPPAPVATLTPNGSPTYPSPTYPPTTYPPVASAAPTPLTPSGSYYATPQYGSTAPVAEAPSSAGTTAVIAPYAPPAPRVETLPPASSPLAMWQPGHWSWSGTRYSWIPGHYAERPSPSANWVPGS
jgi:hypothetical protein